MTRESAAELLDKALLLLASTRAALKNGCRHYDEAGTLLADEEAILIALDREGEVTVDESDRSDVTTVEAELATLREDLQHEHKLLNGGRR